METKDWIVMLVPIVCNGIMLAIYNRMLDRYFTEKNEKRLKMQAIIDNYMEKLKLDKSIFTKLCIEYEKHNIICFYPYVDMHTESLQNLRECLYSNRLIMKNYIEDTEEIIYGWDKIEKFMESKRTITSEALEGLRLEDEDIGRTYWVTSLTDKDVEEIRNAFSKYRDSYEEAVNRIEKRYYDM